MNAGHESSVTRGLSASSEARQMMADWLRITQAPKTQSQAQEYRTMLIQRYPYGLMNDAEIDALVGILDS
ncbi:hypothetical protein ACIPO9_04240 [Pseudomonas sp. NPDC090203]|jgi:hypothetical protein|uniref:hypothetical protein n=1 Tax=Pseudomonas TaxID=286 RepID=UPI0023632920|nr:hypothetical protein [Pseudomonas putida]MDD1966403.1 hypothetical protein [Pseudomonas putida]